MASKSLTFDLYGKDRTASAAMRGVGNEADRMGQTMRRVGAAVAAGLAIATGAAVAFGISSVKAFADAQAQQEKLNFAYEKFPAIADVTRESYDRLNSALAAKTGFDDDAIASGQGVLAQFQLTGEQLQTLTPLLLDYARASGQDVVSAAEDIGKAMLGQGRALKGIGIDFQDAGSVAANFDQVMSGLTTNVGGYAEQFGTTAAGKFEILTMKWGDFQERVGSALLPGLEKLMEFTESDVMPALQGFAEWFSTDGIAGIEGFVGWLVQYKDILGPAALALGALTVAQWALNVAMDANPVGLVILGIGALITLGTLLVTNWETVKSVVVGGTSGFVLGIYDIAAGVTGAINGLVNGMLAGIGAVIDLVNPILAFLGLGQISIPRSVDFSSGLAGFRGSLVGQINSATGVGGGGKQGISGVPRGAIGAPVKAFADGGIVKGGRGGVIGLIGEKNYDELVTPLKPGQNFGGGTTVNITVQGAVGNEDFLAKTVVRAVQNSQKRGQTPRGALV